MPNSGGKKTKSATKPATKATAKPKEVSSSFSGMESVEGSRVEEVESRIEEVNSIEAND